MTDSLKPPQDGAGNDTLSLPLLADAAELLRVRVKPAEFARLLGVSRQTVSQWVKKDVITINPLDGRLDVTAAVQQVLRNSDPGKMRARVLRAAVDDVQSLRLAAAEADERVSAIKAELHAAHTEVARWRSYAADVDCLLDRTTHLVREREADFRASADSENWRLLVQKLESDAADFCGDLADVEQSDDLDALLAEINDEIGLYDADAEEPPCPTDL